MKSNPGPKCPVGAAQNDPTTGHQAEKISTTWRTGHNAKAHSAEKDEVLP